MGSVPACPKKVPGIIPHKGSGWAETRVGCGRLGITVQDKATMDEIQVIVGMDNHPHIIAAYDCFEARR